MRADMKWLSRCQEQQLSQPQLPVCPVSAEVLQVFAEVRQLSVLPFAHVPDVQPRHVPRPVLHLPRCRRRCLPRPPALCPDIQLRGAMHQHEPSVHAAAAPTRIWDAVFLSNAVLCDGAMSENTYNDGPTCMKVVASPCRYWPSCWLSTCT